MRELQPGLWHWEALHPDWEGSVQRRQPVSSYAVDDGDRLLLFDPIALPNELVELAGERDAAIVLTCPWHERDTRSLMERLDWPLFAPPPDSQEDLMRKYRATAEETAGGSPDLAWLLGTEAGELHLYAAGDRLPGDVEALPGWEHNDAPLWIESRHAVVVGDALVDHGRGLEILPRELMPPGVTREQIAETLRPLLALPIQHVLATHGGPTDRDGLERALS